MAPSNGYKNRYDEKKMTVSEKSLCNESVRM